MQRFEDTQKSQDEYDVMKNPIFRDVTDAEILASDRVQKILDDRAAQSGGQKDKELRRKLLALRY